MVYDFVFFDFECRQDSITECVGTYKRPPKCTQHVSKTTSSFSKCKLCENCKQSWCGSNKHVTNLAIAHTICKQCIKDPECSQCYKCGKRCPLCSARNKEGRYVKDPCIGTCGGRERVFRGEETAQMFSKWLFARKRAGFTAVAHNLSGYDGYFLLEYLLDNGTKPDSIIYQGSKITYMEVKRGLNIRVVDSLKFLPMKLAKLSKAFGLQDTKGWFPTFSICRETGIMLASTQRQNFMAPNA